MIFFTTGLTLSWFFFPACNFYSTNRLSIFSDLSSKVLQPSSMISRYPELPRFLTKGVSARMDLIVLFKEMVPLFQLRLELPLDIRIELAHSFNAFGRNFSL
jgi:hypothetical protein